MYPRYSKITRSKYWNIEVKKYKKKLNKHFFFKYYSSDLSRACDAEKEKINDSDLQGPAMKNK